MPGASRSIRIHAPIDHVYAVITDFAHYPDFLPDVKATKVKRLTATRWQVRMSVQVMAAIDYTIDVTLDPPHGLSWTLIEGTMMKQNDGGWQLVAQGDETDATYSLDVALSGFVPKMITNALVETTLPATLEHFKQRAESTWKKPAAVRGRKQAKR